MAVDNENYINRVIAPGEPPLWQDFGEPVEKVLTKPLPVSSRIIGVVVLPSQYVQQNSDTSFLEFRSPEFSSISGVGLAELRSEACGVASLHMALGSLNRSYPSHFTSEGQLTLSLLALHRGNYKKDGKLIQYGNPVLHPVKGWYHNALVYAARKFGGVNAFRTDGLRGWDDICTAAYSLDSQSWASIVSVKNRYWRGGHEGNNGHLNNGTHLILVHGFTTNADGRVQSIIVTDPHVQEQGKPWINHEVHLTENLMMAPTGRAVYLQP